MRKLSGLLVLLCAVLLLFTNNIYAAFLADINQDDDITLEDVVLGLQIVAGESPAVPEFVEDLDVNEDNHLGMPEVLRALQAISTDNLARQHQARIVGPLSGAGITAYLADNLAGKIEGTIQASKSGDDLAVASTFDLSLAEIGDDAWVVVSATSGKDIDHDGNDLADTAAVQNSGTLHAIAKASDWRTRNIVISPLTEIVWRYTENIVSTVPASELEIRLNDLARYLIKTDIDGSGGIDWYDLLAFNPADQTHRDSLKTNYIWLTTEDIDGNSILGALLAGDEELMLSRMDDIYSYLMTRSAVPDSRYNSVKITLSIFGQGSAASGEPYNLTVDSTATEPVVADHVFLPADDANTITYTAAAAPESQILNWTGCDTISTDLSQCTVSLNKSQEVVVNFGRTSTQLKGTLHDLTNTTNYIYPDFITVFIPADMTDMIDEMALAAVDDFIVGDDNGGFLRRISGITQKSPTEYELTTVEAFLDEIVAEGSGYLYKDMTNGDLEGYAAPSGSVQSATISPSAFTGLAGVQLIPSNNPDDKTFKLTLGQPDLNVVGPQDTLSAEVTLSNPEDDFSITARGEVDLEISLDTGVDFSLDIFDPLQSELNDFKFITILDAKENVELSVAGDLTLFEKKKIYKKVGTLKFTKIMFGVGPVPVWVTPTVDIILFFDGHVEAEITFGVVFQQTVEGGVLYNKNTGWQRHQNFSSDFTPSLSSEISASVKGGIKVSNALKIYDATGPAVPLEAYSKIKGSASTEIVEGCFDVLVEFMVGAGANFEWELGGNTKFGKMLHLDEFQAKTKVPIITKEWPIFEYTLFNNCPDVEGSHLLIEGDGLFSTISHGDLSGLSSTLTIRNDGDEVLYWNTSDIPQEVTVFPAQGELNPGENETVQLSIATAGLPVGRYTDAVYFYNEASISSNLPDEEFGNTYKYLDIQVNDTIPDIPTVTSVESTTVGKVDLAWDFSQTGAEPLVGYQVFATTTPAESDSFFLVHTTNIYDRQASISGFSPGEIYSIKIRAYSNSIAGPFSSPISVTVAGTASSTQAGTVVSNGRVWMDRNLGASRVATSMTDEEAYGDLYQWGRGADGQEKRDSGTTSSLSTTDIPGHGHFVTTSSPTYDWRSPQNDNLWQGVTGVNNPCPAGFRLPTKTEWQSEFASWRSQDYAGAYNSPLKLVPAGYRNWENGTLRDENRLGYYWSATVDGSWRRLSWYLSHSSGDVGITTNYRAFGFSVRCIQDYESDPVSTVTSAGQVWMDRNLGASRVATSMTDTEAYGDLYQWGRGTDGHEKRTSGTTSTLSSSDTPGHGNFITTYSYPNDWRSPQNDNLWQGITGVNNPCPEGSRLPTETEWETERASWNSQDYTGAYNSPLKLVPAGYRRYTDSIRLVGSSGFYWSSTDFGSDSRYLFFHNDRVEMNDRIRVTGFSVRCIKD